MKLLWKLIARSGATYATLVASEHSPAKATHCNFATSRGCLVGSLAKAGTHGIRLVKTWGPKPIGWFMGKNYRKRWVLAPT